MERPGDHSAAERRPEPFRADPDTLRVSDQDRHEVAEILRQAAGEGRIDLDELDERLEAAYSAKTYGELVPLTADLPVAGRPRPVPHATAPPTTPAHVRTIPNSVAVMGDCKRQGVWRVPEQHIAFACMGSVTVDLRQAVFSAPETTIQAFSLMAGVDIVVNAHTEVIVEGIGVMGDFSQSRDKVAPEITAASPVVRVKGLALMGAVNVRRKPMPEEPKRRRSLPRS